MILDEFIKLRVNPAQLNHFRSIGLDVTSGDEIEIRPEQLNQGSNFKINCKCDICGKIKQHPYRRYLRSTNNSGYYACSSKCAQDKVKKTFLEKYGTEHHFQSDKTKEKIKSTWLDNYGVHHFSHSDEYKSRVNEIQNKRKKTLNKKYINSESLVDVCDDVFVKFCENHGGDYKIEKGLYHNRRQHNIDTCTICYPYNENRSIKEKELFNFIKSNTNNEVTPNHRLNNKEIDVFIPSLGLGFEFNGLFWHDETHIPNNYHLMKTETMVDCNIKLIHIYEDDWMYKRGIVESRILNMLGKSTKIYARKCKIKVVTPKQSKHFLEKNHIQGNVNGSVKLGLFYGGELVAIMTFGRLRKSLGSSHEEGHYEMLRFCNKLNTTVIGGASRLFKHFLNSHQPISVKSYADRSWSDGSLYVKLGFDLSHKTKPNYYYIINKKRYNRYNFRKDKLVSEGFDKTKTERQIMIDRGYHRIYDSGSLVFIYQNLS